MTITVTGDSVMACMQQLGHGSIHEAPINIRFRSDTTQYDPLHGHMPLSGCVVYVDGKVPLEFTDTKSALAYLGRLLSERNKIVRTGTRMRKAQEAKILKGKEK